MLIPCVQRSRELSELNTLFFKTVGRFSKQKSRFTQNQYVAYILSRYEQKESYSILSKSELSSFPGRGQCYFLKAGVGSLPSTEKTCGHLGMIRILEQMWRRGCRFMYPCPNFFSHFPNFVSEHLTEPIRQTFPIFGGHCNNRRSC